MEGDLLSNSGQVRSRSGQVSLQPKLNSFELDSEVGRLVVFFFKAPLLKWQSGKSFDPRTGILHIVRDP